MSCGEDSGGNVREGLRVESLTVRYRGRELPAVRSLTFHVPKGGFLALVGASGSGKTSLLRAVAGLLPPGEAEIEGSVWIAGRRVDRLPPERRGTPLVFQNLALFPHLSARGNILAGAAFAGIPSREASKRAERLADLLEIADVLDSRPDQLSGGQAQRVALARALVSEPQTLLMDEPFGSLDAPLRRKMRDDLHRLWREFGTTCVLVTHDPEEAADLGTHLGVLDAGRLVQLGERDTVLARPRSILVAEYFGYDNQIPARAVARAEGGRALEVAVGADAFQVRDNPDIAPPQEVWVLLPRSAFFRPANDRAPSLPVIVRRLRPTPGGTLVMGVLAGAPGVTVRAWVSPAAGSGMLSVGQTTNMHFLPEAAWVIPRRLVRGNDIRRRQ